MQEGSAMPAGGRLPRSRFLEAVPHPQVSQYFLFHMTAFYDDLSAFGSSMAHSLSSLPFWF